MSVHLLKIVVGMWMESLRYCQLITSWICEKGSYTAVGGCQV